MTPSGEDDSLDSMLEKIVNEVEKDNETSYYDTNAKNTLGQNYSKSELISKLEKSNLNNGWNEKNESIIISLGENSASYKWMHERSSYFYLFLYRIINVILIVFSTGLSAETLIPDDSSITGIVITRKIFTYTVTLISVILSFFQFQELSEKHNNYALQFSRLYNNIKQQMCMYRRDRPMANKYVSSALKTYDSLVIDGPSIPSHIISRFKTTFANTEISLPDIADTIEKIEIITEPVNELDNANTNNKHIKNDFNTKLETKNIIYKKNKQVQTKDDKTRNLRGKGNFSNLKQITNAFKASDDIQEQDIDNANFIELSEFKKRLVDKKSDYEYNRFLEHGED